MVELDLYGIRLGIEEIEGDLSDAYNRWSDFYPSTESGADLSANREAFYKISEQRQIIHELDTQIDNIRHINKALYKISEMLNDLTAKCKMSKLIAHTHVYAITTSDYEIQEAERKFKEIMEKREEQEKFIEDQKPSGKKKRKPRSY